MNRHELLKQPIDRAIEITDNMVPSDRKVTMQDINKALDEMHITFAPNRSKMIPKIADYYYNKKRLDWGFSECPSAVIRSSYRAEAMAPKEDED
jgi:hypothetical protein